MPSKNDRASATPTKLQVNEGPAETERGGVKYSNISHLSENTRIKIIGEAAMAGNLTGVMLEKDQPEKIERYTRLIKQRHPGVRLISTKDGPKPQTVILQFGPRLSS